MVWWNKCVWGIKWGRVEFKIGGGIANGIY